jgi:hypothetical protein
MAEASGIQSLGISMQMYKPTIDGSTSPITYEPRGTYLGRLTEDISAYRQVSNALGGWWSADFQINDNLGVINEWLDEGLGRHIDVFSPELSPIFQGFANKITAVVGPLTITVGPLMDVGNRVRVFYSTVDTTTTPPTMGVRARTTLVSETESTGKYGRLVTFLSTGGSTPDAAVDIRNQWLAQRAFPLTTQTFNLGGITDPSLTVEVLGYVHLMKKYYFSNDTGSGTINASTRVEEVIEGQANTIFNEDHDRISANTIQIDDYVEPGPKAFDVVKTVVAQGDAADARWLFGIYEDFVPWYNVAPSTIEYHQRMTDEGQQFFDATGALVYPWQIRPGKWLFFDDLLIGRVDTSTDLRRDPRAMFIESVNYIAPWSLSLLGGKTDTLNQRLAKMGISGVGS